MQVILCGLEYLNGHSTGRSRHFLSGIQLVNNLVSAALTFFSPQCSLSLHITSSAASDPFFINNTPNTEIYTLSLHEAFLFFFKEHASQQNFPFSLESRLPI